MRAITIAQPGGPEVLKMTEVADLRPGPGEIVIRVRAAGLNNADLLQRRGLYPPPAGASEIPGLEVAGEVLECGPGVSRWKKGDRAMALLSGGGYAEQVKIPAELASPVPENLSDEEAAAIPEAFITAYLELVWLGKLQASQSVLIHSGASGVGTAAIQTARELGAWVFATASTSEKLARCQALGAQVLINYREEDFSERVLRETHGAGVDVILDLVGAAHWEKNIRSLKTEGTLLLVGLSGGGKVESLDLRALLAKRARILASTLRNRSDSEKAWIIREWSLFALPRLRARDFTATVDRVFPFEQVADAHRYLEAKSNIGKVVLKLSRVG